MSLVCALMLVSGLLICQSIQASQPIIDYHEIYIDPNNPNSFSNASCYNAGKHHPCADINLALAFPERDQPTKFILSSDAIHHLENDSTTTFAGSSHVAFYSDNGTAIVQCINGAGLAFMNYDHINISGISFQHCGAWRNSTSKDFTGKGYKLLEIRVALYFYNCRDVSMVNMSVLNSTEAVGVVMYSTAGVNYIGNSQFEYNGISESNSHDSGGGGFAVEFNYCKPGDDTCSETNHQTENNQNARYSFENCSFSYNRGVDQSGKNKTSVSIILLNNKTHYTLGRGGGLSLYFKGNATNNNITLSNCEFTGNSAAWGAGIITEFVDSSIQNFVHLKNVHFDNNKCYMYFEGPNENRAGPGGGIHVASFVYYPSQLPNHLQNNYILLRSCRFRENSAIHGGALSISPHYQPNSHQHQLFHARVEGSSFLYNSARLGSAVSITRGQIFAVGAIGNVSFASCVFNGNSIVLDPSEKPYSVGIGALYLSEIHVIFEQYLYFTENNGTALAIVGTTVTLADYGNLTFTHNMGKRGGAVAFLGANLVIGNVTSMTFNHNYASVYGGAIFNSYIGKEDLQSSIKCFLQYFDPFVTRTKWNTVFTFRGNSAGKLGQSIFSSSILPCSWSKDVELTTDATSSIFCWNNSTWIYENSTCDHEIHTFPSSFNLSQAKHSVYPGHRFRLHIQSKDDLEHNVSRYTIYTATTSNETVAEVDPQYEYITDGYVAVNGEEGQNLTLELDTSGDRDWHIPLKITLEKCPAGFVPIQLNNSASQTVCDCLGGKEEYTFKGNLFCDKFSLVSRIKNSYWIGTVPAFDNTTLLMGSTRFLHKFANQDLFPVARRYERLDYNQCLYLKRTGPLCGQCRENYSTAVNSYDCVPCTSESTNLGLNIFLYILLTYLPYLIVFIVILYFDIRLMSGPLIGFILYAQLIGSGVFDLTIGNVPYYTDILAHRMQEAYRMAYGFFNLNSFVGAMDSFCIHEGFSALDVICLDYAVAAFPLVLVLILYIWEQVRHKKICGCRRPKKKGIRDVSLAHSREQREAPPTGRALIHPFAGFIYLSYTKFVLTSTKLMSTTALFDKDGEYKIKLIYYAGHYQFGELQYILPFGLLSYVIFIFFGFFLPLLLLGLIDFVNWLIDQPRFRFLNCGNWLSSRLGRVNMYRDAFQGCYKPNCYYFTGLYFLFRTAVFIVFAFSTSSITIRSWQNFLVVFLALLVARAKPYKEDYLNTWDVILFLNLFMINIVSGYLYDTHIENVQGANPIPFYTIGLILIWWPMLYFILYLFWLVLHKRRIYRVTSRNIKYLKDSVKKQFKRFLSKGEEDEYRPLLNPTRSGRHDEETSNELTDSNLFSRAEEGGRRSYQATPRQQPSRPRGRISRTVIEVHGKEGEADVRHTTVTGSSGVATGSGTEHTNTNTGSSQGVRVTDTD